MSIRPTGDGALPLLEAEVQVEAEPQTSEHEESDVLATLRDFESSFDRVKAKRLGVNVVVLKGLQRTKQYIVARELRHLPDARNLDELKDALLEAWAALLQLDIFEAVDIVLDEGSQLPVTSICCPHAGPK